MAAKVFDNEKGQKILWSKDCIFSSYEDKASKNEDIQIHITTGNKWDSFMRAIDMFSEDYMSEGRT